MALHTFKGILLVAVCVYVCLKVNAIEQIDNCPPIDKNIRCFWFNQKCKSNSDCSNGQICCAHACGTDCIDPTGLNNMPRPGVCPAPKPVALDFCARTLVLSNCRQDSDCKDRRLCCYQPNCGTTCNNPGPNTKPGRCPKTDPNRVCTLQVRPGDCIDDSSCPADKKCCRVGCNRVCVNPEPECGPVCLIYCPFGNVLDGRGCPTCTCKTGCKNEVKPLASVNCGSGRTRCPGAYTCVSAASGDFGVCCPLVKDGECPALPPGTIGACVELCSGDSSCPGSQKCCSNGCGHVCKNPAGTRTVKDGECPALPPGTIGACVELCSGDSSCPGSQKCCSNGCGHVCKDPVNTNEGVMK